MRASTKRRSNVWKKAFKIRFSSTDFQKSIPEKSPALSPLERLNKEVRRRSRTVGIFPSTESYLRLMTASLIEYSEDHLTGASYISAETLREQKIELEKEQKAA